MKNYFLIIIMAVVFFSCTDNAVSKKTTPSKEDSVAYNVAVNLFKNFNAHNWQGMANLYTDTAEFKDPSFGINSIMQTRQQTIAKYTELSSMFKDIRDSVVTIYQMAMPNVVAVEFVSKGTAPDGSKLELPICSILTVNDSGLIKKDFTYYDNSGNK